MIYRSLFVITCFGLLLSGCKPTDSSTSQSPNPEVPVTSSKADNQPKSTRGNKPRTQPANVPAKPENVNSSPKPTSSKPEDSANKKKTSRVFDASDAIIPLADKAMECSGTFIDASKRSLKRISVLFKVNEEDPANATFRITLDCNYSVITHTSTRSASLKFSCKDFQKAIAAAPVCDARTSVGGKEDLVKRVGEVFNTASVASTSRNLELECEPLVVPGTSTTVALEKPFRTPIGFPEPIYHILFSFGPSLRFQEFYHASSVDDITCPTALRLDSIQTIQDRISSTVTSIVNAITNH